MKKISLIYFLGSNCMFIFCNRKDWSRQLLGYMLLWSAFLLYAFKRSHSWVPKSPCLIDRKVICNWDMAKNCSIQIFDNHRFRIESKVCHSLAMCKLLNFSTLRFCSCKVEVAYFWEIIFKWLDTCSGVIVYSYER